MNNKLKSSKSSSECIKIRKVKISSFRIKKSPSCKTGMFSPKNLHRESKLESTSKQDSFKSSAFNQYLSPQGSDDDSVIMTWKELLAPTEKKSFWSLEEEDECSCFEIVKGTRDQGKNLDIKMKKEIGSTWNIRNHKADRLD